MGTNQAVITILVAVLGGSLASLTTAYATRPKTKAEAQNLNAAAGVSISADIREWSQMFVKRTEAAERAQTRPSTAPTRPRARSTTSRPG
jgi:hypothetical protein